MNKNVYISDIVEFNFNVGETKVSLRLKLLSLFRGRSTLRLVVN